MCLESESPQLLKAMRTNCVVVFLLFFFFCHLSISVFQTLLLQCSNVPFTLLLLDLEEIGTVVIGGCRQNVPILEEV